MTQTAYPYVEGRHGTSQRFELTHLTTAMTALHTRIKEIDALLAHHALHLLEPREEYLDVDTVGHVGLVDELVGLRKQSPRVEGEDPRLTAVLHRHIGQHLIFDAQARRHRHPLAKGIEQPAYHLLGGRVGKACVERCDPCLASLSVAEQFRVESIGVHAWSPQLFLIIPAPTVSLVSGSMNTTLPVTWFSS